MTGIPPLHPPRRPFYSCLPSGWTMSQVTVVTSYGVINRLIHRSSAWSPPHLLLARLSPQRFFWETPDEVFALDRARPFALPPPGSPCRGPWSPWGSPPPGTLSWARRFAPLLPEGWLWRHWEGSTYPYLLIRHSNASSCMYAVPATDLPCGLPDSFRQSTANPGARMPFPITPFNLASPPPQCHRLPGRFGPIRLWEAKPEQAR
jgi:hypothetical protein